MSLVAHLRREKARESASKAKLPSTAATQTP